MSPAAFPIRSSDSVHGLLLVGHGTRDEQGLAEFFQTAEQIARLAGEFVVEPCFLEIAQPDIARGVRRLLERRVKRLTVAPLLLFAAGHAKRDIPLAVQQAVRTADGLVDGLTVQQAPPLGCHPQIVELSTQRFAEAIANRPPVDPGETLLLLVGRGSSDPSAIAEMHRFAEFRAKDVGVGRVATCFAAVASPSLDEALQRAADLSFRRIVVQPHLLFAGHVLGQIAEAVADRAARQPGRDWILTPHLGPSPLVAEAVLETIEQTNAE